jgi:protein-S-isoprenylcysteine O-methyltransferase Ste14
MLWTGFVWISLAALDLSAAFAADPSFALGLHAASRTAYVGFAALVLDHVSRHPLGDPAAAFEGFRRFRSTASLLMLQDAVSFAALVVASRGSLEAAVPTAWVWGAGALLVLVGVASKAWAAWSLRSGAYYWIDFFLPPPVPEPCRRGPYRFLRHPMYTVGYAHLYGFALLGASSPALLMAAADQAVMLAFNAVVEEPHVRRLYGRAAPRHPATGPT